MDTEWATCKAAKKLAKFGAGFYCDLVEAMAMFIGNFNGFFMAMRSKYTKLGRF